MAAILFKTAAILNFYVANVLLLKRVNICMSLPKFMLVSKKERFDPKSTVSCCSTTCNVARSPFPVLRVEWLNASSGPYHFFLE